MTFVSLYVLFSHFRPRDVTPEVCFFQLSSYVRVSTWICMHNLWKDKRHILLRTSCVLNWESKTCMLKISLGHLHHHFTTTATRIHFVFPFTFKLGNPSEVNKTLFAQESETLMDSCSRSQKTSSYKSPIQTWYHFTFLCTAFSVCFLQCQVCSLSRKLL